MNARRAGVVGTGAGAGAGAGPGSGSGTAATDLPATCLVDWGIGGFGVMREIFAGAGSRAPSLGYFSDSGMPPYGTLAPPVLRARLEVVARALADRGVRHLVLACNAASTVAAVADWPAALQVTDVITHGVGLVKRSCVREVGIVGGARTIRSGRHARALRALGIRVHARVAQPLSLFVERGVLQGADVEAEVERVVSPLRRAQVPALLLACTHYPALGPLFRLALPAARLLDPAKAIAQVVLRSVKDEARTEAGSPRIVAMTSGSTDATREAALRAFAVDPGVVVLFRP